MWNSPPDHHTSPPNVSGFQALRPGIMNLYTSQCTACQMLPIPRFPPEVLCIARIIFFDFRGPSLKEACYSCVIDIQTKPRLEARRRSLPAVLLVVGVGV